MSQVLRSASSGSYAVSSARRARGDPLARHLSWRRMWT